MVHNIRSPEQWDIIYDHVYFQGKTVIDLGCGKGDIVFRAFDAGANIYGVDLDAKNIEYILSVSPHVKVVMNDIETMMRDLDYVGMWDPVNIIICFSVLPYLKQPGDVLKWINDHSDIALIECQYAGDGPGLDFLSGNDDMKEWLLQVGGFKEVDVIGHTLVEGRNKKRFIWRCQ